MTSQSSPKTSPGQTSKNVPKIWPRDLTKPLGHSWAIALRNWWGSQANCLGILTQSPGAFCGGRLGESFGKSCNLIGGSWKGPWGVLRKICKILGGSWPNPGGILGKAFGESLGRFANFVKESLSNAWRVPGKVFYRALGSNGGNPGQILGNDVASPPSSINAVTRLKHLESDNHRIPQIPTPSTENK